ncbi:MAG: universal stress protein [Streptosporangiales bacterium]|nr:universal stress protein [Streptosporangiales bacterium]
MTAPVVVGVDGSEGSRHALEWAIGEARTRNAPLRVVRCEPSHVGVQVSGAGAAVHFMDDVDLQALKDESIVLLDRVRLAGASTRGIDVEVEAVGAPPVEELIRRSADAQLVVVGSRGNGWLSHLGHASVVTAVTRHAKCPIVVVPG